MMNIYQQLKKRTALVRIEERSQAVTRLYYDQGGLTAMKDLARAIGPETFDVKLYGKALGAQALASLRVWKHADAWKATLMACRYGREGLAALLKGTFDGTPDELLKLKLW